jgi:preprotein translocase subunit SecB
MAEDNAAPAAPAAAAPGTANPATFNIVGQYIRDLSFENPGAPTTNLGGGANPNFNVGINVAVKKQADDLYAVELQMNAKANRAETLLFSVELVYGGVFRLKNVPENQMAPLLMVECPRLIFPFARQVLASTVQAGGFPPLLMEPVDFQGLYIQNLRKMQAQQAAAGGTNSAAPAAPALDSATPDRLKN